MKVCCNLLESMFLSYWLAVITVSEARIPFCPEDVDRSSYITM